MKLRRVCAEAVDVRVCYGLCFFFSLFAGFFRHLLVCFSYVRW